MFRFLGTPVTIDGKTAATPGPATTTRAQIQIPNPLRPTAGVFARVLTIRHFSGAGNLLVYLPSSPSVPFTVKPNESLDVQGVLTHFYVQASSGLVEWEAIASVAA